jgi:hypothetical protein
MEYIEFGTAPNSEDCVSVDKNTDYLPAMCEEARRFKKMLEDKFPNVSGFFTIKSNSHDFGSYLEVRYNFSDDEQGWSECNLVENNCPEFWTDTEVIN